MADGVIEFTQDLYSLGLTPVEIRRRVRRDELHRIARGAYDTVDPRQLTVEEGHLRLVAAMLPKLAGRPVLSHATAGVLHGLWLPADSLRQVHVARAGARDSAGRRVHIHPLGEAGVREVLVPELGVAAVTELLPTALTLLRTLPMAEAVAVADSALRAGLDRAEALASLDRVRGRRGTKRARLAIEFADAASESAGESQSRWVLHQYRVPAPVLQRDFHTATGQWIARCDFWWPKHRLIGEFDGKVKYGRLLEPGQSIIDVIQAERAREVALVNEGHRVTRWTWQSLDPPSTLVTQVGRALRRSW